jgi:hypothetical protein
VEILTLPRISITVDVPAGGNREVIIDKPGTLQTITDKKGIAAICRMVNGQMEVVREFKRLGAKETTDLQPGEYIIIYRWDHKKTSIHTNQMKFKITSGSTTILSL